MAYEPITFTKTDDRGEHELTASSPADEVRLRFDGWREKGAPPRKAAKSTPASSRDTSATPKG